MSHKGKNSYRLINPHIEGTFNSVTKSASAFGAGKKLYKSLSNFFTNYLDNFHMTIQNLESKQLTHFRVSEQRKGENLVDFNLVKLEDNLKPDIETKLISHVDKIQSGGRGKHRKYYDEDSSSSSSDSTSDEFNMQYVPPISSYTYFYLPYYKLNAVNVVPYYYNRVFVPTFSLPVNPVVEIRMDLYK